ncbi:MAG: NADH-quinone oxidoreductase subunit J/K, partial [Bacteroidales bacterium]|nr:NADH-quinone oxidoreductase subunit J/K [Bacteroidales bacterium]
MKETRIALARLGKIDPGSLTDYIRTAGYRALRKALAMDPEQLTQQLEQAGLRGRGGAGFSAGQKSRYSRLTCDTCPEKYVVCNADEGEPGTFKDRVIMENDPHLVLEGILIAAYIIGASSAYIYIRGEYTEAINRIAIALQQALKEGFMGDQILGSTFSCTVEIRLGAGSYLCGEELTLLESLEGKRGYPRIKPPYPAEKGLFGKPTLINNVETLAHYPAIVLKGAAWYRALG